MAILKLRGLGTLGILADPDPYDLPIQAFSAGVNVRFHDGRISRGPVFRQAGALQPSSPRFLAVTPGASGTNDQLFVGFRSGRVKRWSPVIGETDYSPVGFVDSVADDIWSSTRLASCLYVNRPDRVPWVLLPTASVFAALPNWNAGWRAGVLRSYADSLVALNVSEGGINYPTKVRVSDQALAGFVPTTWDESDLTANTYANTIAELSSAIVDGLPLRDSFVIYGSRETFLMQATGDAQIYSIRPLFRDAGAINTNCVVEVDSKHYVFGINDVWVHDGNSKRSIADGRVRKFIFSSINMRKASACFVSHNQVLRELSFCYVSGDRLCNFAASTTGACNRAAVYNYAEDKWSFDDLPYVYTAANANAATVLTWSTAASSWGVIGGAWQDLEDRLKQGLLYLGEASASYGLLDDSVYVSDLHGPGSMFAFPVLTAANPAAYLERTGVDLDELNEELRGYKVVKALWPQGRVDPSGQPLSFSFGSADNPGDSIAWADYMEFDGSSLAKCDYRSAGRYLAMRVRYPDFKAMSLSGLDIDLVVLGRR